MPELKMGNCWQCRGDGYYFRVPDGFNPFYAGGFQAARVAEKVRCFRCDGTGRAVVADSSSPPEKS